jgi:hypothetical protein
MKRKKRFSISLAGVLAGVGIFLLNLFDALVTTYVVSNGLGVELSPIAGALINSGFGIFIAVKVALGLILATLLMLAWRDSKIAKVGGIVVIVFYAAVGLYHVVGLLLFI